MSQFNLEGVPLHLRVFVLFNKKIGIEPSLKAKAQETKEASSLVLIQFTLLTSPFTRTNLPLNLLLFEVRSFTFKL